MSKMKLNIKTITQMKKRLFHFHLTPYIGFGKLQLFTIENANKQTKPIKQSTTNMYSNLLHKFFKVQIQCNFIMLCAHTPFLRH